MVAQAMTPRINSSKIPSRADLLRRNSRQSDARSKSVQFSVVEVRGYERTVADNPSCSCGAPIGIGWSYEVLQAMPLEHYENIRSYRRSQLEMILTREERERILQDWGITSYEIVNATRLLHKVKNQRRQTVRNLNKAERLEESMENAARRLKRAFFLQRSTKHQVRQLQQQANLAAACNRVPVEGFGDCYSEDMVCHRSTPSAGSLAAVYIQPGVDNPETANLGLEQPDALSSCSGFTLGNSTTPSVLEMERFHRELELEMFGDQDLPSMVGRTLELDVDVVADQKVSNRSPHVCRNEKGVSLFLNSQTYREEHENGQEGRPLCSLQPTTVQGQLEAPLTTQVSPEEACCTDYTSAISRGVLETQPPAYWDSWIADQEALLDSPRVTHTPLFTHRTPTVLMEDSDSVNCSLMKRVAEPVTISEEDCEDVELSFNVEVSPNSAMYYNQQRFL